MRKLVLLLVLAAGLCGGYFAGEHRSKEARKALEKAVETGKALDHEREKSIASLRKDLDGIDEKYRRDIETSRTDYEAQAAEWRRTKAELDHTIERQMKKLAGLNKTIATLAAKPGASTGAGNAMQEKDAARLRKEAADLQHEIGDNACLKTQIPASVLDALGNAAGGRQRAGLI